jgi:hypothetical protein
MHMESTPEGGEILVGLVQVKYQLANLTMQLQDMEKTKVVCEHVWCTMCRSKRHHREECPTLENYMEMGASIPFPFGPQAEWCEICRQWGHIPPYFSTLEIY